MARGVHSLLREAIRVILREESAADLSGKSAELVSRLEEINALLATPFESLVDFKRQKVDLDIQVGVLKDTSPNDGSERVSFAVRRRSDSDSKKITRLSSDSGGSLKQFLDDLKEDLLPHLIDSPQFTHLKIIERHASAQKALDVAFSNDIIKSAVRKIPMGSIKFYHASDEGSETGPCSGAYVIQYTSSTTQGWGPLLYDVALEWASERGGGLTADRNSVSNSARSVWKKYSTSRSDITSDPLDVSASQQQEDPSVWGDQISPSDPSDDCDQTESLDDVRGAPAVEEPDPSDPTKTRLVGSWQKSALSRAYKKTGGTSARSLLGSLYWEK